MDDGYFLMRRDFNDAELRMLIDSVLFSKNLTQVQAKRLIEKLEKQSNRYFSAKVAHISNLPDLQHGDNKQLMYALDAVNDAIAERKKIKFTYNVYGTDFKLHPRREPLYIVNPYQIVANNGFYYLIGNYDKYNDISHYRLDKMTNVEILQEKVKPKKEIEDFSQGYNLPRHMAEHLYMFGGPSVRVKMLAPEGMMSELIDWFGKDFIVRKTDVEGQIEVVVKVNEQSMFFWALQYGPYVEVLEPKSLRMKIKNAVSDMAEKYRDK